jgi:hypothetical protein
MFGYRFKPARAQHCNVGPANHAKMYGLYPRKGSIMISADADIAGSDYTRCEGMEAGASGGRTFWTRPHSPFVTQVR